MPKKQYSSLQQSQNKAFDLNVLLKYQIYDGLFLALPFKDLDQASARLSIFAKRCEEGLLNHETPEQIVETYLAKLDIPIKRKYELLFKFLQFIERQIVLFDAIEDSAFEKVNNLTGVGTVNYLLNQITEADPEVERILIQTLSYYKVRITLTAHPTQFYPNHVLAIIIQLSEAIKNNDLENIHGLFLQMGLTRFRNKNKPTPLDEAASLTWFLEHVFYSSLSNIQNKLPGDNVNLELGFWPGGDRDGNPNVTHETTLAVARNLRHAIVKLYYKELYDLQFRLTFDGVDDHLLDILHKLRKDEYLVAEDLILDLRIIVGKLNENYHGLFIDAINSLIKKVQMFGFYFAKLDIRQNSKIHKQAIAEIFKQNNLCKDYLAIDETQKIELLKLHINNHKLVEVTPENSIAYEIINNIKTIHTVQTENSINAIERYIISNADSISSILEVLFLVSIYNSYLQKYNKALSKDTDFTLIKLEVVPLFETIEDLKNAPEIMEFLYQDPIYREHLLYNHNNRQTIMVGFSDGTKDGGYLMANWSIYQAKKQLSQLARKYGIKVIFFDGRGGPPSRGGGNTNDFYRSLGKSVFTNELHLTIQGQTITSNFGNIDKATYNLEQLFTAGIISKLFPDRAENISESQEQLISSLANLAYNYYLELRNDPLFIPYLEEITPLKYLTEANVGSRPAKRNTDNNLKFEDLRAIPFVGAWTQMKQNILGFYGLGYAIKSMIDSDQYAFDRIRHLYDESLFFRTLINNSMQSLAKSNFLITAYLKDDPKYGKFWSKLKEEADLTREMLLGISSQGELLGSEITKKASIDLREKIILPLLVIQQYAMLKSRSFDAKRSQIFEKLIKKSLAANINANRNSV